MLAAREAHPDDPAAASLATADAMETVLSKYLVEKMLGTDTPGTTGSKTPDTKVSKLAREAILEGITGFK